MILIKIKKKFSFFNKNDYLCIEIGITIISNEYKKHFQQKY